MRSLYEDAFVCIISGKRPNIKDRKTETKFKLDGDLCIVSNNSTGYDSKLPIINVPDDFREYYRENHKITDFGMYAPLSRSYAIKYARDNGYKYCIQIDDNICKLYIQYVNKDMSVIRKNFRNMTPALNAIVDILRYTNSGMSGLKMQSVTPEQWNNIISERFVYSVLALKLDTVPYFWGDNEDDIHMRLQLAQKKIPVAQLIPIAYGKLGQISNSDESGCRAMYTALDTQRGATASRIYGDIYSRGITNKHRNAGGVTTVRKDMRIFKHKLKPFQVGIKAIDNTKLNESLRISFQEIFNQ